MFIFLNKLIKKLKPAEEEIENTADLAFRYNILGKISLVIIQ